MSFFLGIHCASRAYPFRKGEEQMAQNSRKVVVCGEFPEAGEEAKTIFIESFRAYLRRILKNRNGQEV